MKPWSSGERSSGLGVLAANSLLEQQMTELSKELEELRETRREEMSRLIAQFHPKKRPEMPAKTAIRGSGTQGPNVTDIIDTEFSRIDGFCLVDDQRSRKDKGDLDEEAELQMAREIIREAKAERAYVPQRNRSSLKCFQRNRPDDEREILAQSMLNLARAKLANAEQTQTFQLLQRHSGSKIMKEMVDLSSDEETAESESVARQQIEAPIVHKYSSWGQFGGKVTPASSHESVCNDCIRLGDHLRVKSVAEYPASLTTGKRRRHKRRGSEEEQVVSCEGQIKEQVDVGAYVEYFYQYSSSEGWEQEE